MAIGICLTSGRCRTSREARRATYRHSFSSQSRTIEECRQISLETFRNKFFSRVPVVLKQQFKALPAIKKWHESNFSHLRPYGHVLMPVEITQGPSTYATESDSSFEQVEIPFALFLDLLQQNQESGQQESLRSSMQLDNQMKIYLAQHALFDSIPDLYKDVCLPTFVSTAQGRMVPETTMVHKGDIYNINAWIGLSTHTPLHRDPYHNIFAQLHSRKRVLLFPPSSHASLKMHTDPLLKNTSQIKDIFDLCESEALPVHVRHTAFEATIESGDGLYIPEGWFHSFKGDPGVSSSVNWWFR